MRDPNRLNEIETFLAVVGEGSFSAAARLRGMTPSAVSKTMARLENRIGAALVRRSTRKLQVTDEGHRFAQRAQEILDALDAAEREAGCGQAAGTVRIATSASYANHVLAPVLAPLLQDFPELEIELVIGDGVQDLYRDPIDLAIRAGPLPDSAMMARSLGRSEIVEVTAPSQPAGLRAGFAYDRRDKAWNTAAARLRATDGNTIAALALRGGARARVAHFLVREALERGTLVRSPVEGPAIFEEFHVLYVGHAQVLPRRVGVVLDHIVANGRVDFCDSPAEAAACHSDPHR